MSQGNDDQVANALDNATHLPQRNWLSLGQLLVVQSLNAFNDNFVKMLLIALAPVVASHSRIGDNMELFLGAIFSIPYILFAPVAGYLSDRFSKKVVIVWTQIGQIVCFLVIVGALLPRQPEMSLWISLFGFFLLAAQSAFFSPAKMGVLKELVGSRRIGMASGWMQTTLMAGTLGGMWAGGTWFGVHYARTGDAWQAALFPLFIVGLVAVGQCGVAFLVQRTPSHPEVKFHPSIWWEHFGHLKALFKMRHIRLAALGITYFWFLSNAISFIIVTLMKETYADSGAPGSNAKALAAAAAVLGVGVIVGSLFASAVCKRRIELGLVPLGGLGFVIGLLVAGFAPLGSKWVYAGLVFTGFAGGCFMVPLYAFVQDRANPAERARILAAINLMDCLAAIIAVSVVGLLKGMGLMAGGQFIFFAVTGLFAALFMLKLLPQDVVRLMCLWIIRAIYKVRTTHEDRVPRDGGILLLPNHVSYVDALVLSAASPRPVRFVMWDVLYKVAWMNGFLRLFGTVPISSRRAKDAVRTVAGALQEGGAVCVFPEGQLTRVGMMNEVRKGFEIMARQADAPVLPVYMDRLYGSIFSFEGGTCFRKWPKRLRYPVAAYFGEPIPAREATVERVREMLLALGSEAFLNRRQFETDVSSSPGFEQASKTEKLQALANAMRLAEVELLREGDCLLAGEPEDLILTRTLAAVPEVRPGISLATGLEQADKCAAGSVVPVASHVETLLKLAETPGVKRVLRLALCWDPTASADALNDCSTRLGVPVLRGYVDAATGALLAQNVPDPVMPKGEEDKQLGIQPNSLGRLLPGLAARRVESGVEICGLAPGEDRSVTLAAELDEMGFLCPRV